MTIIFLVDLNQEVDCFQNVVFVHDLLAVFLKCDKLINADKIMVSLEKIVSPVEALLNLKKLRFRQKGVVFFKSVTDGTV